MTHQIVAMVRSPEADRGRYDAELEGLGIADVPLTDGVPDADRAAGPRSRATRPGAPLNGRGRRSTRGALGHNSLD